MPWLGGILLCLALILAFFQSKNVFYFPALFFFGLMFVSIPFLTVWSTKRNFRKNPSANKTIRWTIGEQGLKNETEGAETKFMWDKLIKVEEVKSGFLLFPQPRLAHWIPKCASRNDVELNSFRNLVRINGIQVKRLIHRSSADLEDRRLLRACAMDIVYEIL